MAGPERHAFELAQSDGGGWEPCVDGGGVQVGDRGAESRRRVG